MNSILINTPDKSISAKVADRFTGERPKNDDGSELPNEIILLTVEEDIKDCEKDVEESLIQSFRQSCNCSHDCCAHVFGWVNMVSFDHSFRKEKGLFVIPTRIFVHRVRGINI